MKKVLALILLVASAAQANELKKAWNNFGKDNRAISGGKALVAGCLAGISAKYAKKNLYVPYYFLNNRYYAGNPWFSVEDYGPEIGHTTMAQIVLSKGVPGVLFGYAAYLLLKQAWHDAKHALGQDEKKEQTSW